MSLENIIMNTNENEIKQFDDIYFPQYRETNGYIIPQKLYELLIGDLFEYLKQIGSSNEIKVGYILYSKMNFKSSIMNNVLNMLIQKINPNIRAQSCWTKEMTCNSQVQTDKGIEMVEIDKIKIKIIIKNNDKDYAIKKLAEINLKNIKKKYKKISDYIN